MLGAAPVLLDFQIRGQAGDLGARLGRVRGVGAGLEIERRGAALEISASGREKIGMAFLPACRGSGSRKTIASFDRP
jgi:hypothetical protein